MQTITMLSVICAFLVLALLGVAVYTRLAAENTRAASYDEGYDHSQYAAAERIRELTHTIAHQRHQATVERSEYNQGLEAIMQDADARICLFARRANPFTEDDQAVLSAIASKLELAASTFDGLKSPDHARFSRALQQNALNMVERLRASLNAAKPAELPTSNRSVLVYGPMACGKTRNAQAIAAALGLTDIRDDWHPDISLPRINTLVLTNSSAPFGLPPHIRVMSFEEAMRLVEGKRLEAAA